MRNNGIKGILIFLFFYLFFFFHLRNYEATHRTPSRLDSLALTAVITITIKRPLVGDASIYGIS